MSPSLTDNGPSLQKLIDFCESSGRAAYVPSGNYQIKSGLRIESSFFKLTGDGVSTRLIWNNPTDFLFNVGLKANSREALLLPEFENFWIAQGGGPYTPTAGGGFRLHHVSQARFQNVRIDNCFVHYDTEGLTRTIFEGCRSYGNTLHPKGTPAADSCVLRLRESAPDGPAVITPANIIINGCEWTGNYAGLRTMDRIIDVGAVDGLWLDSATYLGLAGGTLMHVSPQRETSLLSNIRTEAFLDGGTGSSAACVAFTEPRPGFHKRGNCTQNTVGGEIAIPSGNGVTFAVSGAVGNRISATIRGCGGSGIVFSAGQGLDATGAIVYGCKFADVILAGSAAGFTMGGGQLRSVVEHHIRAADASDDISVAPGVVCKNAKSDDVSRTGSGRNMRFGPFVTDRPNIVATAAKLHLPFGIDEWVVTGDEAINELAAATCAAKGRKVSLKFVGKPTIHHGPTLRLSSAKDLVVNRTTTLNLTCFDGLSFEETGRTEL